MFIIFPFDLCAGIDRILSPDISPVTKQADLSPVHVEGLKMPPGKKSFSIFLLINRFLSANFARLSKNLLNFKIFAFGWHWSTMSVTDGFLCK
jgi:hypothetical protein